MKTTNHYITTEGDDIPITVEWNEIECKCTSEAGNCRVTQEWTEFEPETITNVETGESFDFYDIVSESPIWSKDAQNAIINNHIEAE